MHNKIDTGGDRRHHKSVADVLPREQRQGAQLGDRLAGRVRVQAAHARQARVESDQQVECLFLPDLTDDNAVGAHPEGLLDQTTEPDLAGALQVGLPGLHGHPVRGPQLELEHLLTGDDPFPPGDGRAEAVEHGGLSRLRPAGHDDVQTSGDSGLQEGRRRRGDRRQVDQLVHTGRGQNELADVDRPVDAGDVGDDDMQTRPVRQHGVHERSG